MTSTLISLSILDPLYTLFGIIIRFIYMIFNNYGLAIIIFTVLIRGALLPFSVKQQKSSLQQQALQPQLKELQRYYGDDKQGYSQAQMELFKKHKISLFGGCLPMILMLVLIWPVYRIISGPLHYMMQVSADSLQQIGQILLDKGLVGKGALQNVTQMNIPIIQALQENPSVFAEVVNKGLMKATDLLNLNFLGLNLGLTPAFSPSQLFGPQMSTYLPLLLLPILATVTTYLQSVYSQKTMGGTSSKKTKEEKEAERKNPALRGQNDTMPNAAESSMKSMKYMMPIMTLMFTFTMPAAMSVYWIVGNLIAIFQSWLMYTIYNKPMAERQAASDAEYEAQVTARARGEREALEQKAALEKGKKKRRRSN